MFIKDGEIIKRGRNKKRFSCMRLSSNTARLSTTKVHGTAAGFEGYRRKQRRRPNKKGDERRMRATCVPSTVYTRGNQRAVAFGIRPDQQNPSPQYRQRQNQSSRCRAGGLALAYRVVNGKAMDLPRPFSHEIKAAVRRKV